MGELGTSLKLDQLKVLRLQKSALSPKNGTIMAHAEAPSEMAIQPPNFGGPDLKIKRDRINGRIER
jgi:hypothetical protein